MFVVLIETDYILPNMFLLMTYLGISSQLLSYTVLKTFFCSGIFFI